MWQSRHLVTTLVEQLQNEVTQLLHAHYSLDSSHQNLIDELENVVKIVGEASDQSTLAILADAKSLLSREIEEENSIEALLTEFAQRLSENASVKIQEELLRKMKDSRKYATDRCMQATNSGFFEKLKTIIELNAARATPLAQLDEEKEYLIQRNKAVELEKEECCKNTRSLQLKVKSIEKTFVERSRFGAWVCDTHAHEEDSEECPTGKLIRERRQALHCLTIERKELLIACEQCGIDTTHLLEEYARKRSVMSSLRPRCSNLTSSSSIVDTDTSLPPSNRSSGLC